MKRIYLVLSLFWPVLVGSNEISNARYYQLTGLAEGEVLNVRSGPSTEYDIIGKLKMNNDAFEILERDPEHEWGRILWQDREGWVFLEYVQQVSPDMVPASNIPIKLHCSGAEPYWDYTVTSTTEVSFKILFDDFEANTTIESVLESANSANIPTALVATGKDLKLTAVLDPQQCQDGTTQRLFGWSIDLLVERDNNKQLYSGCCSL